MKIIGLTGGIGSGKTTVASFFKEFGVPIYIADVEAKKLTNRSKVIRRKITALFGEQSYKDDLLNSPYIANIVFNDAEKLEQLNAIIHPKVAQHFKRWIKKQDFAYCIKEAAVLFENGAYAQCDATILVTAPKKVRLERVMERDHSSQEEVEARMKSQWNDAKKKKLADYIIKNTSISSTKSQVKKLHETLI